MGKTEVSSGGLFWEMEKMIIWQGTLPGVENTKSKKVISGAITEFRNELLAV